MSRENKTRSCQREYDITTTVKYTRLKKQGTKRVGSVVNSTVYSSRKPKIYPQDPHGNSQPPVTPVPKNSMSSSVLHTQCIDIQADEVAIYIKFLK